MPISIIGKVARVVEAPGLTIDEYAGGVATKEDRLSIAVVTITAPGAEPWLTLGYDEWICVTKGRLVFETAEDGKLEAKAGETVFVPKGTRFQPSFPDGDTTYIPVCLPGFKPELCVREDEGDAHEIAANLAKLHAATTTAAAPAAVSAVVEGPETIYHMAEKSAIEAAIAAGEAYFPPTFEVDGHYTHATAIAERLIETFNTFYTGSTDDWVCLTLSRKKLRSCGIVVKDEPPMAVGASGPPQEWTENWGTNCPHIYGGIPPSVIVATCPMTRDAATGRCLEIAFPKA